jgi:CHAD domain-containing protein
MGAEPDGEIELGLAGRRAELVFVPQAALVLLRDEDCVAADRLSRFKVLITRLGARLARFEHMRAAHRPLSLLGEQIRTLESHLSAVRDGDPEGVHQARVVTRRIRELLPLTAAGRGGDALAEEFRCVGRSLGAVRDADVQAALLRSHEARIPGAAPTLVLLRQQQERRRLTLMRALIKEFERLEIDRLLQSVFDGAAGTMRRAAASWDRRLRRAVTDRAAGAREAILHATGVYFPKRTHRARIAIKKFRYATEIAAATGLWNPRDILRELKKGQELLGRLHDRQELIDRLPDGDAAAPAGMEPAQLRLAAQVVEAEAHDLHCRYLARRQRLLDAANAAQQAVDRARRSLWPVAAGALMASSTLLLLRRGSVPGLRPTNI